MSKFIGLNNISLLNVESIVKNIYKPEKKEKQTKVSYARNYKTLEKLISYIKNERFSDFIEKLNESSIKLNNKLISSHKIDIDNIIYPEKYLSAGVNGITFLAKLKKEKKGKKPGDNQYIIVKYEVVKDDQYFDCQDEYIECIDKNKDQANYCKVKEIYCRLDSAFIEIYINKNHIQKLNCRNFAMFYAFFMCPTYRVIFDENNKDPSKKFINKYIDTKRFCLDVDNDEKMHVFSVYEYIPGVTLYDYIASNNFRIETFYQILLQIFGALSIAQVPDLVYYNHNDLHCKNIMIESYPSNKSYEYTYEFPFEKTTNCVCSNKRAVIIDQGNASILFKKHKKDPIYSAVYGWYKKKITKVIKNFNSPYADVYRVITHSYTTMLSKRKPVEYLEKLKHIINDMFSLNNGKYNEICTTFIENEDRIWFDYYVLYLEKNLSKNDFSELMKKMEKITYEYAYNYFYYIEDNNVI